MMRKTKKEKDDNTNYVIGLIDGENALTTNIDDYPRPYGIPENARGLEYFERAKESDLEYEGDLVFGYKTKMYRKYDENVEWKKRKRFSCKNHGIFAVFRVEHRYNYDVINKDYPHTIGLSKPLFFLKSPISFEDLKTLKPEPEYVNNCRRSVTRFSKKEAKRIFELMIEKNPDKAKEIKKIF